VTVGDVETRTVTDRIAGVIRGWSVPILFGWLLIAVATNVFVPQLETVGEEHNVGLSSPDSPSLQAMQRMGEQFAEFDSDSSAMIVIEGDQPLGDDAHRFYDTLVRELSADTTHVQHVQDFWGDPLTAAGSQSDDGKAAYVQVYLAGNQGETLSLDSVKAVRDTVDRSPAPPGVTAHVTGAAPLFADQLIVGSQGIAKVTLITLAVIIIMLLMIYRSIVATILVLLTVIVELTAARGVVALLADAGIIGLSTFSTNLLTLLVIAAGTDYAIFLLGRYHEARHAGEDRQTAFYTTYRSTGHVILGSGLTVAGAVFCLSFTRLPYFQSMGPPGAIGVLVALAAALTLAPAVLAVGSAFGLLEPRRAPQTRRWRRIGTAVVRWPAPILVVTIAITVLTALLAGLLPLVRSARTDAAMELRGSARAATGSTGRLRIGLLLVQTTLSTALLVGAGLFLRSVDRVRRIDLGIDAPHVLAVGVNLSGLGVAADEAREFHRQAVERLATVPGVEAVGPIVGAPFMSNSSEGVRVPGLDTMPRLPGGGPYNFRAGPGTLEALGVRLLRGRLFDRGDRAGSPPVAVVSDRMARLLWLNQDPIGRCFVAAPSDSAAPCREVVGIVADLHRQELDEAPFMLYFTVIDQWRDPRVPDQILVRTKGSPDAVIEPVRRALLELRSDLPYVNARPYEEIIAPQSRSWRLGAAMLPAFGMLSLAIAAMGLYGVLSFTVTQRIREFGIRTALGATPSRLVRGVVAGGLGVAAVGVALGLVLVGAISGRLAPLLYRTSPGEPLVLASAALVVVLIGTVASAVPARRAARVDPIGARRSA